MRSFFAWGLSIGFGLLSGAAAAAAPHFVSASAAWSGNGLTASFKEAGLGANQNVDVVLSATLTANWACINNSGKNPSAANKRAVTSPVSKSGTFSSGKNGSVSASLTLDAPAAPPASEFSCPSGQKLTLMDLAYASVNVADKTNGVSKALEGSFSRTLVTLN
jgi:hypothetical protein